MAVLNVVDARRLRKLIKAHKALSDAETEYCQARGEFFDSVRPDDGDEFYDEESQSLVVFDAQCTRSPAITQPEVARMERVPA